MSDQCVCDNIFPAVQFHLRMDRDKPLSARERTIIEQAIKIPMSGFVSVEFAGRRIIITSTIPKAVQEDMRDKYLEVINACLGV